MKNPSQFDVFIVSAPKDHNKLPYVIDSIRTNLCDSCGEIIVVSPTPIDIKIEGVKQFRDEEVLTIQRNLIPHRPNWIFQQFLKLFQDVTKNDRAVPRKFNY